MRVIVRGTCTCCIKVVLGIGDAFDADRCAELGLLDGEISRGFEDLDTDTGPLVTAGDGHECKL
jgi:hypothetical protein